MTLSSIYTNVPTTAISFNRKYNESTTSQLQIEALTPHGTTTMDKPGHVPFVIMYNQALRFFSSIIGKNFHILISSPVVITSLKLYPLQLIDALVTSVIFSSELNFEISPITTTPGAHTYVEKTVLLTNTAYLADKLHTDFTLQMKPDLPPITTTATTETSFTWYSATASYNSTSEKLNDDLKTVSKNTADQLTTHLISPNPPRSQNIFLPMITPLMTSHVFH